MVRSLVMHCPGATRYLALSTGGEYRLRELPLVMMVALALG